MNNIKTVTLIGPSEVKVDLADFGLKLRENLLSNLFTYKNFSCRNVPNLFELLTWPQKNDI